MPRKSDVGPIPGAGIPSLDSKENGGVSIDDNVLPKSIVTRLAKGVLPQNTNIQKDATLALTKGATVFINYLCATANENAAKNSRKTINPKDILEAISQLELDDFRPRLEAELAKFEEISSEKRAASKKAAKDKESSKQAGSGGAAGGDSPGKTSPARRSPGRNDDDADEDGMEQLPPTKKRKANGKATPVNGRGAPVKSKATTGASKKTAVTSEDEEDEEEDADDGKDAQDEEEDEEDDNEDEDENEEAQNTLEDDDAVEEAEGSEPPEDEALDNGYDSD